MVFGGSCLLLWLVQPRLAGVHPFAAPALLLGACAAIAAFGVAYGSLCASLWLRRPFRLAHCAVRWFARSLPLVTVVAPWLGVPPERVRRSLMSIEEDLACLRARSACSGRVVCISPSDLPERAAAQIQSVAAEYDCDFLQATNGTEARQLILQVRPLATVAVCCPPDMVRRIRELQYQMPLVTVGRRADSCAVCSMMPDVHKLIAVLEALRCQMDEAQTASHAVPVRQRH